MEEFFDRRGPWGRVMMCNTASVQVCLDAGDEDGGAAGYRSRWRLLHAIGPVLVAAFANSPLRRGTRRRAGGPPGRPSGPGWTPAAPGRRPGPSLAAGTAGGRRVDPTGRLGRRTRWTRS